MENEKEFTPEHLLIKSETILDTYTLRYLEMLSQAYGLYNHDLKNCQNALSMSVDLYEMTDDVKYIGLIADTSDKTLEHLNLMKCFEPILYSGKYPGLYSALSAVQNSMAGKNFEFEIVGKDGIVFTDSSLPKTLKLLISTVLEGAENPNLKFEITESADNKTCFIDITFNDISIPK